MREFNRKESVNKVYIRILNSHLDNGFETESLFTIFPKKCWCVGGTEKNRNTEVVLHFR